MTLTLFILSIAPALAICGYVIHKDRFDKEPFGLLVLAFIFGIFSIFPAIVGTLIGEQFLAYDGSFINTALYAFFVVALSEEFAKFIFLRFILFNRKAFSEPMDGIVYAVMIGMGFASFENILYVAEGGWSVAIMRMITAIPAHAIFAIIMGYYVGLAKFDLTHRNEFIKKGLLYPILLHGAYDFFLLQKNMSALSFLAFIGLYFAGKHVIQLLNSSDNNLPKRNGNNDI